MSPMAKRGWGLKRSFLFNILLPLDIVETGCALLCFSRPRYTCVHFSGDNDGTTLQFQICK